jgi:hypothetical protein
MKQLSNEQLHEFVNTLNGLSPVKNSQQEMAQIKTLRKLKDWSAKFNEEISDIRDKNCAIDGDKILVKDTIRVSRKNEKGDEVTEEQKINRYTPEGQEKMKKELREFYKKTVGFNLEVVSTIDDTGMSAYQKEVLTEYGFLVTKEQYENKVAEKKGKNITDETANPNSEGDGTSQ